MLDSLELDFNTTKLGSSVNFAKLTGQAAFYKQKFHDIVWANSLRVGLAQPFANSRVPLSEVVLHRRRQLAARIPAGWRRTAAPGAGLR